MSLNRLQRLLVCALILPTLTASAAVKRIDTPELQLAQSPPRAQHESVDAFLSRRPANELHLRGGTAPYTATRRCSIEEAEQVVAYAKAEGVTLTVEEVQAASPFFREADTTADRFRVTTNIIPIIVVGLAVHFARGCIFNMALDGASHLAHNLSEGAIGETKSAWEYVGSCVIGGFTGGFSAFSKGKVAASVLGPTKTTAFKNSLKEAFKVDKDDLKDTLEKTVEVLVPAAGDYYAVDDCALVATGYALGGISEQQLDDWAVDCVADQISHIYGTAFDIYETSMAAQTHTPEPVIPLMLMAYDPSNMHTLFDRSGATIRVKYSFMATQTGSVTATLLAVNDGATYTLSTETVAIDSSLLNAELEGTNDLLSQTFDGLNGGTDPRFRLFLRLQHSNGYTIQYETPRGGGFPLFLKSRDLPPIIQSTAETSGNNITFRGSYQDPEAVTPSSLELRITGPSSLSINLLPLGSGTARPWSGLAFLSNGIYGYHVVAVEGTKTYTSPSKPLRVSSTPPVVDLDISTTAPSIGSFIDGTVTVTDAVGALPNIEVGLSCDGRGPFYDSTGAMVRKVTTNGNGQATFRYEVTTSGSQTILAMEPSHQYALADFEVEGSNSDVVAQYTWGRDATRSTEDVAVYDLTVHIEYPPGQPLDVGDYVYFSANHGHFEQSRDGALVGSIVKNTYVLTKAEAESGSEIITLTIPEYGVATSHIVDLPVGLGARLTRTRLTNVQSGSNDDYAFSVDISPNGQFIARFDDENVFITPFYATAGGASFAIGDDATCLRFSPDSTRLAIGDEDGGVTIYHLGSGQSQFASLTDGEQEITNIHWLNDNFLVMVTDGDDGVASGQPYRSRVLHVTSSLSFVDETFVNGVSGSDKLVKITCSDVSDLCAAASWNARWSLIHAAGGEIDDFLHPDNDDFPALTFNSDGSLLLVGSYNDNTTDVAYVKLYSVSSSGATALSPPLTANTQVVFGAAFFHDGSQERLILAGSQYTEVYENFSSSPSMVGDPHARAESTHFRMTPDGELVMITKTDQWIYNFSSDQQGPGISIDGGGPVPYGQTAFTLSGTVTDDSPIASAEYSRGAWQPLPLSDGSFDIEITPLVVGSNVVELRVIDRYGNTTTVSIDVVRLDDTEPPDILSAVANPSDTVIGTPIEISCTVTDADAGVAGVSATIRNAANVTVHTSPLTASGDHYVMTLGTNGWAAGTYFVDLTAVDDSPNANTRTVISATSFRLKVVLGNPSGLTATTVTPNQVALSWAPAAGAASYDVFRRTGTASEQKLTAVAGPPFNDFGASANGVHIYRVQAVAEDGRRSAFSNREVATTVTFTNDPIVVGSTPVRAVHWNEVRAGIALMRTAAGLSPALYSRTLTAGMVIFATDLAETRTALNQARTALAVPAQAYTHTAVAGRAVRAIDMQELRNGIK